MTGDWLGTGRPRVGGPAGARRCCYRAPWVGVLDAERRWRGERELRGL